MDNKKVTAGGITALIVVDGPSIADQIRQIMREEIAANEERIKGEPELISPLSKLEPLGVEEIRSIVKKPSLFNDLRPVVKKMLHVLVEHEIPISSLERVLESLRDAAHTSTLIQERWANDDFGGYKNL